MIRPTLVEPVKLIRRTAGCSISASTTGPASLALVTIRFTTPGGRPASASADAIAACVRGHSSDAFSTTVLPYASGVATARVPRITGAFHGAMPATTPTGWRTPIASRPGMSDGMTSPISPYAWAAASRSMPAASEQLNMPQPNVPPVSSVITDAIASARSCRSVGRAAKQRAPLARTASPTTRERGPRGVRGAARIVRPGGGDGRRADALDRTGALPRAA